MQVVAKNIALGLFVAALTTACISPGGSVTHGTPDTEWKLVYANDENGNSLEGSKEVLIASIRAGKPVRIYTAGRHIDHATGAQFLSIFKGEVFAQITPIESQRPTENPAQILFREPGVKWRSIFDLTMSVLPTLRFAGMRNG